MTERAFKTEADLCAAFLRRDPAPTRAAPGDDDLAELKPLTDQELDAMTDELSNPMWDDPTQRYEFSGAEARSLVAEVRRLRGRLQHHHVAEGLPDQDDTEARAIQELQDAMDKFHLVVENAEHPARLRELLASRCRICSEYDGTLAKRDKH